MLYIRDRKQENVQAMMKTGGQEAAAFLCAQIEMTADLLRRITSSPTVKPKAIVVANRIAEELLGRHAKREKDEWLWLNFTFTEMPSHEGEASRFKCSDWGDVPVFFSPPFYGKGGRHNTEEKRKALGAALRRVCNT